MVAGVFCLTLWYWRWCCYCRSVCLREQLKQSKEVAVHLQRNYQL